MITTSDNKVKTPGATYTPWTDGYAVGFRCQHANGAVEYIYLNPSQEEEGTLPNVFIYQGPHGDPALDGVAGNQHFVMECGQ